MNLNDVVTKHAEWKLKFRKAISDKGTMEAEPISKDNYCEFGQWLHNEAKSKFGNLSGFSGCVTKHAAFHVGAGKVVKAVNDKKYAEAEAMLGFDTRYTAASNAFGAAITHLREEVKIAGL
jgi:methyl-accepting chemotaxis protein